MQIIVNNKTRRVLAFKVPGGTRTIKAGEQTPPFECSELPTDQTLAKLKEEGLRILDPSKVKAEADKEVASEIDRLSKELEAEKARSARISEALDAEAKRSEALVANVDATREEIGKLESKNTELESQVADLTKKLADAEKSKKPTNSRSTKKAASADGAEADPPKDAE
jgi:predicted  nucleic acid-binding Zn-ribbon protein